jgi:hypothetical protein
MRRPIDRAASETIKDETDSAVGRMMNRWIDSLRSHGKWALYLLVLLTPGSFVLLPAYWVLRWRRGAPEQTPSAPPRKVCADPTRP